VVFAFWVTVTKLHHHSFSGMKALFRAQILFQQKDAQKELLHFTMEEHDLKSYVRVSVFTTGSW